MQKWIIVCLLNFLMAALMGLALRFSFIASLPLNYRFLTHAHSHVAMLGWVYLMVYAFFFYYFVPNKTKRYYHLFWMTQFSVIGMMLSFPFQGYALFSITFSTLHIFCSYYFAYLIFKHHQTNSVVASRLLKMALGFMLMSTIGVWCLGPAVAMQGQASAMYQIAIQFFLHFQFNGWFLFAVITVFFHKLGIQNSKAFRLFFIWFILATGFTFAMPVNWFVPDDILVWINGVGIICQLIALYYFVKIVKSPLAILLVTQEKVTKFMYGFAMLCFVFKIVLQSASVFPEISNLAYQNRNFTIGFIHLTMLGVVTGFLFALLLQSSLIKYSKVLAFGMYVFVFGFVLTELLLLVQGAYFYLGKGLLLNYHVLLFLCSILLPLGIVCIIYNILKTRTNVSKTA